MADLRVSQLFAGVYADWDPSIRIGTFYVEAILDPNASFRVGTFYVEYLADQDPLIRATQYHLEVLYSLEGVGVIPPEQIRVNVFPKYVPVRYGESWRHNE